MSASRRRSLSSKWRHGEGMERLQQEVLDLQQELEAAKKTTRVEELTSELKREIGRARSAWRLNCEQYDAELVEKESEIAMLRLSLEPVLSIGSLVQGIRQPGRGSCLVCGEVLLLLMQ